MSEFIRAAIDMDRCVGIGQCGQCVRVCPVNVFDREDDRPSIIGKNQDECTLCDLCLEVCKPEAIVIHKLYEDQ